MGHSILLARERRGRTQGKIKTECRNHSDRKTECFAISSLRRLCTVVLIPVYPENTMHIQVLYYIWKQ